MSAVCMQGPVTRLKCVVCVFRSPNPLSVLWKPLCRNVLICTTSAVDMSPDDASASWKKKKKNLQN